MRAEEDGASRSSHVLEDPVESVLHQRIEALGWLVEDRELRVVLEGLDHTQLLAHAARVVADASLQVVRRELQPLAELSPARRGLTLQVGQVVESVLAGERSV